jgi:23S rRNA pseudouridine2605 synthase
LPGRLDVMTEGLLILTNDGNLALRVTHPSWGLVKRYVAKVRGTPTASQIERLERGIVIDGRRARPEEIRHLRASRRSPGDSEPNSWFEIVLREGRNQEVRRLFDAIGHPVVKLRRVAIGPISDDRLAPGEWRDLEPDEVRAILAPKR